MDVLLLDERLQRDLHRYRSMLEERHGGAAHLVFEGWPQEDGRWRLEEFGEPAGFDLTPTAMVERAQQFDRKAIILVIPDTRLPQAQHQFEAVRGVHLLAPGDLTLDLPDFEAPQAEYDDAMHQRVLARARQSREELARRTALRKARESEEELNPFSS